MYSPIDGGENRNTEVSNLHIVEKYDIRKATFNKEIDYKNFRQFVIKEYILCNYENQQIYFTSSIDFYKNANKNSKNTFKVIFLSKNEYTQLLLTLFKDFIKHFVQNTRKNKKSVKTFNFKKFKVLSIILLILLPICLFLPSFSTTFKTVIILYYIVCICLKSFFLILGASLKLFEDKKDYFSLAKNNEEKLPIYTILIPMFKENKETINQSLNSIKNIDYPKDLLDVKLVLEEDDIQTRLLLKNMKLPEYITQVWTPYFEPRTKPKACNVASLFAKGDILVIFDAEDISQPNQLKNAVYEFNKNKNIDVLQGCLRFYNHNTNILTSCFNIEYNVWFKIVLWTFSRYNIQLPLGGTSNHIKFNFLEKNNFWDSYNVTEDLELSAFTNYNHCVIKHLNSNTEEWCVIGLKSWLKQRTRWMKGYLLTYLLYFFDKKSNNSLKNIFFYHIIIGYSALSFLLLPILFFSISTINNYYLQLLWCFTNSIYYITYIFLYTFILKYEKIKITKQMLLSFIIYPFYFILHFFAAYFAIFEVFYKPFYWAKTKHLVNT